MTTIKTPNLDRVQRYKDHPDEESQFTMVENSTGHWVGIDDVRAAYSADLSAAVAAVVIAHEERIRALESDQHRHNSDGSVLQP
jgi:hypothetical protein